TLSHTACELLEQCQTVIVEATFTRRASRNVMQKIAAAAQATFHGFWLEAPLETMMARADARAAGTAGNADASDATGAVVAAQATDVRGEIVWHRLDSSRSEAEVLADALA